MARQICCPVQGCVDLGPDLPGICRTLLVWANPGLNLSKGATINNKQQATTSDEQDTTSNASVKPHPQAAGALRTRSFQFHLFAVELHNSNCGSFVYRALFLHLLSEFCLCVISSSHSNTICPTSSCYVPLCSVLSPAVAEVKCAADGDNLDLANRSWIHLIGSSSLGMHVVC